MEYEIKSQTQAGVEFNIINFIVGRIISGWNGGGHTSTPLFRPHLEDLVDPETRHPDTCEQQLTPPPF